MMWRDVIQLVGITEADDGGGGIIETETRREVFANRRSIRQSEFYQAHAAGLKPEMMFEIRLIDYADEEWLVENGKKRRIMRTYSKNGEIIELVCSGVEV